MNNICYVIMPYGGDDVQRRSLFDAIFENIIEPAAIKAGFKEGQVLRQKDHPQGGTIVNHIVSNIANAQVVVADLSYSNANVFYELGLSHVFHKSSTVLICNEKCKPVPFDLASQNIIFYNSDEITTHSASKAQICQAIEHKYKGMAEPDNIVYENIHGLGYHLVDTLQMKVGMSSEIQLRQENKHLRTQLSELQNGYMLTSQSNIDSQPQFHQLYRETRYRMQYSGTALIDTLRKYAEERDIQGFLDYFTEAMKLGIPIASDIHAILTLFGKKGFFNHEIQKYVLQLAQIAFPDDNNFENKLLELQTLDSTYTNVPTRLSESSNSFATPSCEELPTEEYTAASPVLDDKFKKIE